MFPIVKNGVPKPQWPFELRPPQVSCGRVYEQESDSDSEPETKKKKRTPVDEKPKKDAGLLSTDSPLDSKASLGSKPTLLGNGNAITKKPAILTNTAKLQSPVTSTLANSHKLPLSPMANTQDSLKSPVPVCEEEDEKCFICGDVGTLMLCDFPACPRVYHKMCIIRVANQAVDEDWATSDASLQGIKSKQLPVEGADDDTWFCPLHNCVGCGALEQTSYSLRTLNPPAALLTQLKIGKLS